MSAVQANSPRDFVNISDIEDIAFLFCGIQGKSGIFFNFGFITLVKRHGSRIEVWRLVYTAFSRVFTRRKTSNALKATDFEEGIFIQPAFVYGLRYLFRDELSIIFHMMWPNRFTAGVLKQLRSHYTARTIKLLFSRFTGHQSRGTTGFDSGVNHLNTKENFILVVWSPFG